MAGVVESVNVGTPREVSWRGQDGADRDLEGPGGRAGQGPGGPTSDGDEQGNPEVHGGVDKALYAYAAEDYEWWGGELGRELGPGTFGDNLTVRGIDVSGAVVGERWRVGGTLLEVRPARPCFKLGIRMGSQEFPRRFAAARRPGAYLRILAEGEVGAGDPVEVVHRPGHGLTVAEVSRIYHDDHAGAVRGRRLGHAADRVGSWSPGRRGLIADNRRLVSTGATFRVQVLGVLAVAVDGR